MTSIREYINSVGEKYIWGLSKDDSMSKVKHHIGNIDVHNRETPDSISMDMYRRIILSEPLTRKAIYKKNRDTFTNWFVVKDKQGEIISDDIYKHIRLFDKKTMFPSLLFKAGVSANIYGTGFIEKIYNENMNTSPMSPITLRKNLINLELLDSETITERMRNPDNDRDTTRYLVYRGKRFSGKKLIHPSRIEVVKIDSLPYSFFGISIGRVLWNILKSKTNADIGAGELLNWYGRGMYDITIDGMTDDDEKRASSQVKKHPDYLIHDDKIKVDVVNPTRIDPNPFYEYFYTNIAAALEMPKQMLTGMDIGNVTGSEAGIAAYYSDIQNIQELIFTPIIENIYKEFFRSIGKTWDYDIEWNPIYVDELSNAKILQVRSYSATQAFNSGIVDTGEARDILNNGIIELDIDKKIEQPDESEVVSNPNIEPQRSVKPESAKPIYTPFLSDEQQEMIERMKLTGKIEEEMQERRIKEAQKKLKKGDN